MVGFDVVFDIIVKVLVSLALIAGTGLLVFMAIYAIATGMAVWACIWSVVLALFFIGICGALCASAQGEL